MKKWKTAYSRWYSPYMIQKKLLQELYLHDKLSMKKISEKIGCSEHTVDYWMRAHRIPKRSISEAIYTKNNPNGDPFKLKQIKTLKDARLYGMGLGIYWGEGNKKNRYSIRVGNTDPLLILTFMQFLTELFGVDKSRFKFGLQIFSDIEPELALDYWATKLCISKEQFSKVIVTKSGSVGTYREKNMYGVLTLHFNNKKLRDIIVGLLPR